MYKYAVVLALFALAASSPVPETAKDLKTDSSIGLGYSGLFGIGPLSTGLYNPYVRTVGIGARSVWSGTLPLTYRPPVYNPTVYNPSFYNPNIYNQWW